MTKLFAPFPFLTSWSGVCRIRTVLWCVGILCIGGLVSRAMGSVYYQSFSSPVNSLPVNWVIGSGFNSSNGIAKIEYMTEEEDPRLHQFRSSAGSGHSFIYFNGSFGDVENGIFDDFALEAIVRLEGGGGGTYRGFLVRSQTTTYGDTQAYYISISTTGLRFILNPTSNVVSTGTLLKEITASLSESKDYLFRIEAVGELLSAWVYEWDAGTNSYSTLVVSGSIEDDTYSSGRLGFRTAGGSNNYGAYWKDLMITTTIPEPSLVGISVGVGILGWVIVRRRRTAHI